MKKKNTSSESAIEVTAMSARTDCATLRGRIADRLRRSAPDGLGIFPGGNYFVPLKDQPVTRYLYFAVEFKGYIYVLSIVSGVFTLGIYEPAGEWLMAATGFEAQRIAVNYWRDMYAQNSQVLRLPDGSLPVRTEPSISHWLPSTP